MTRRLVEALDVTRSATESTVVDDGGGVDNGVSANLCEALDRMINHVPTLDVGVTWVQTRPMESAGTIVEFAKSDASIFREAARSLRERERHLEQ